MKRLNRKGFTLIELLAVIVVLAIILVIAVPRVMDVITNARKESLGKSAQLAAKQMQQYYAIASLIAPPAAVIVATDCPTTTIKITDSDCHYTSSIVSGEMVFVVTLVGSGKFLGWTASSTDGGTPTISVTP